ncbi:MAG: DNA-3-methyladenine glycosylase I [Pseudomonadota bacterium]|nr:DNA-3-methyladenine glycosylase I [Pseudomonadota bacterium]
MPVTRCQWATASPLEQQYHDSEWGVPLHDDRKLFEFLILEGAQAGLSWSTILNKREGYRAAFNNFDAEKIAAYDDHKIRQLLANPAIVRNRLKVNAAVTNARIYLEIMQQSGGFSEWVWKFVDGEPVNNDFHNMEDVPANTPRSDLMAREMKKRGFKFVGTTICYAFMQATGMVNDHTTDCYRWREIAGISES